MGPSLTDEIRNQGRGITGALLVVGLSFIYTMETWWLGWRLPSEQLIVHSLLGLVTVFVVTPRIGFRWVDEDRFETGFLRTAMNFPELVLRSLIAAFVGLLAFEIVSLEDPPNPLVRIGLFQIVPLGFGAAVANRLLQQRQETVHDDSQFSFRGLCAPVCLTCIRHSSRRALTRNRLADRSVHRS